MFYVKEIDNIENGKKYKVEVELPMNIGWVNDINLVVEKGYEKLYFPLKHKKNENKNAAFGECKTFFWR